MENTPKQLALQLGALISLYVSIGALISLLFAVINVTFPDATDSSWQVNSYQSSIRWGIAMIVVFFPTYLILTRFINKFRRHNATHNYLSITKWLIYLSLLAAGLLILGNLVAVILTFLEGELTNRFLLKAGTLLLIVGGAFYYYVQDARDYWNNKEKASLAYGAVVSALVLIFIVIGFTKLDNPQEMRDRTIDQRQISNLQEIQSRVSEYIYTEEAVPNTLEEAYGPYGRVLKAPEGRSEYVYEVTENGFRLCAEFAQNSYNDEDYYFYDYPTYGDSFQVVGANNWNYQAGNFCFERTVVERNQGGVEMIVR